MNAHPSYSELVFGQLVTMQGQEVPPETPLLEHIQPSGRDASPDPLLKTSARDAVEELPPRQLWSWWPC